jgi:hypothetical protein
MKTRALPLALPLLLLLSCTRENHASVAVQLICYPTDTCTFSSTCDKTLIGSALLDVSVSHSAMLFLQVENQLTDNTNKDSGLLNTNGAHVNQVSVSYDQVALPTDNYYVSNMGIPAGSKSVIAIDAVRDLPQNFAALNAGGAANETLVAKIKLRGYYDDGSNFETGEFTTGIDLCAGCIPLPQCPAGNRACPFEGMEPVGCGTVAGP